MPDSPSATIKPDYGLDAPGAVRNLLIAATVGFLLFLSIKLHLWSGTLAFGQFVFNVTRMSLGVAIGAGFMGSWMLWDSKVYKVREREKLLDLVPPTAWAGPARVLDVGCGRGLMLIGAAKRLTSGEGSAVGIDLWQEKDLSGNRPEAALENARIEGVADRVEVRTADMRKIPFPDASFDTVVSASAIHNIYSKTGRAEAIAEICRVLKPGGSVLIVDIRHIAQYAAELRKGGCTDARRAGTDFGIVLIMILTLGMVTPGNLIARKNA